MIKISRANAWLKKRRRRRHLRDHLAAPIPMENARAGRSREICPVEAIILLALELDAPAPDVCFHVGLRVLEKRATSHDQRQVSPIIPSLRFRRD